MKTFKIKNLKIGHRNYKVQQVPAEDLDGGYIGEIDYSSGEIVITENRPRDAQAEIIVHEVLHALLFDIGLLMGKRKEEKLVRALSPRLTAFLADNPAEVRELLRMLI